jgi:hypothetical protein
LEPLWVELESPIIGDLAQLKSASLSIQKYIIHHLSLIIPYLSITIISTNYLGAFVG